MKRAEHGIVFSASDLADFVVCQHITTLGLRNLETPLVRKVVSDELAILQEHGIEHERNYVHRLIAEHKRVVEIPTHVPQHDRLSKTIEAMQSGADVVYQAAFQLDSFLGYADFLLRVESPSRFGGHSYEVADTKLATKGKARHLVQVALYSEMLEKIQGVAPVSVHLALGDDSIKTYRMADYSHYFSALKERFLNFTERHPQTSPEACSHCQMCPWEDLCEMDWIRVDHLNQVANIRKNDIGKLNAVGIVTLEALATTTDEIEGIGSFPTLKKQAALQLEKRQNNIDISIVKEPDAIAGNGFFRLPEPDEGDLFFDMEGYPYEKGGLEYLFGVYYRNNGDFVFRAFWGQNRRQEKQAFEQFIDFVMEKVSNYPKLHIYHYADYERRALMKLMQVHGTREAEVDQLLRDYRMVDLYAVVQHSVMTSESRYSIKNLETFYMKDARTSAVKNAGASIIYYENWLKDRQQKWLDDIERYNKEDCVSTKKLLDWLLEMKGVAERQFNIPIPWQKRTDGGNSGDIPEKERSQKALAAEALKHAVRNNLTSVVLNSSAMHERQAAELILHLLDFYWRELKPTFWKMYEQQEKTAEELIDDFDAIGGLELDENANIRKDKQSYVYSYRFSPQEFRLRVDDVVRDTKTLKSIGTIGAIDLANQTLDLRIGGQIRKKLWADQMPLKLSIASSDRVNTSQLDTAIVRFASSRYGNTPNNMYKAIWDLLQRQLPDVKGSAIGGSILSGDASVEGVIDVVGRLNDSYLIIQGPPGTGKTYTGARVILSLLGQGKRVGVCAMSHKAVANLLNAVTDAAIEGGKSFVGARRGSRESALLDNRFIRDVGTPDETLDLNFQLVGGTAWTFAREESSQTFDFLFVDEAGQVSLANLVAMGCAAKNIVLLGDQMQLGQPLQGTHPGDSGLSALEYILRSHATVPPELGILLNVTYRMHPDICRFISDAVYDGRLTNFAKTRNQKLVLNQSPNPVLKSTGIIFDRVLHTGCAQTSTEEGCRIRELIKSLLKQEYVDIEGTQHAINANNILVVAPYNAQVRLLRTMLPPEIAVGTVDKFQGQEAEIVIVSMTTSGGDDMPRNMEFLLDRHRLNVAISRAKTLAIVVACPKLLEVSCTTPEQMALVNTVCWIASIGTPKTSQVQLKH